LHAGSEGNQAAQTGPVAMRAALATPQLFTICHLPFAIVSWPFAIGYIVCGWPLLRISGDDMVYGWCTFSVDLVLI
jgi:hypothetical protein